MTARYLVADVFDGLATLPDSSVDLVVTSPPFLALRSYLPKDHPDKDKEIGSESTPAEFLDVMFRFTAELRRVIAPHGSIAIELGDTYAGAGGENHLYEGTNPDGGFNGSANFGTLPTPKRAATGWPLSKSKTLIPELYRIGLAYGINPLTGQESPAGKWRVRNVVTWARPNPPVGALGDKWRPATSDVVIACLSGKRFWDDLATRKPFAPATLDRSKPGAAPRWYGIQHDENGVRRNDITNEPTPQIMTHSGAPLLDYWEIPLDGGEPVRYGEKAAKPRVERGRLENDKRGAKTDGGWNTLGNWDESTSQGAPLLDYWEIPPTGYSGSHYAVFPPALVVPLVQAMCPQRVCRVCGEPSRRIVATEYGEGAVRGFTSDNGTGRGGHQGIPNAFRIDSTLGWSDCGHDSWRPGLVLDPFAGSGTTGLVATGFGHDAVLIDLDERNAVLAEERIGGFLFEKAEL